MPNSGEVEVVKQIHLIKKWLRRLESMIIRPTGSGTLHDPVTVTDTATVNLTLAGQNIQADIIGGGTGDVVGPAGATGNNLAVFDGATGKLIKDGGAPNVGNMTKAVYDIDNDGIVDKSETIDDGAGNSASAVDIASSVSLKHTQGTDTALGAVGTKNPPIDADLALYRDSAAANVLVTSTWTQIKAFLKTYFDTIYAALAHTTRHAVGGADSVFPADPNADRYLMWDDVPGELVWSSPAGGGDVATDAIWDALGDLAVGTGADTAAKLSVGADGKYLKAASGEATGLKWDTPAGSGDVVGPAGATTDHLAVFDGATGKLIKDGGAVPAGGGDVIGPATNTDNNVPQWDGADSKTLKDGLVITNGTYTPTLYNTTNVAASIAYPCQYTRVGNVVTVSGIVNIDPTSTAATTLGISLPIASTIGNWYELAGAVGGNDAYGAYRIYGDTTNNRVNMNGRASSSNAYAFTFVFMYQIL